MPTISATRLERMEKAQKGIPKRIENAIKKNGTRTLIGGVGAAALMAYLAKQGKTLPVPAMVAGRVDPNLVWAGALLFAAQTAVPKNQRALVRGAAMPMLFAAVSSGVTTGVTPGVAGWEMGYGPTPTVYGDDDEGEL